MKRKRLDKPSLPLSKPIQLITMFRFATIFLLLNIVSSQPQYMNTRDIPYPSARFIQFRYIGGILGNEIMSTIEALGYTEDSWNKLGSNPIESISFEAQAVGRDAIESLGISQAAWDCWINHYAFFDWDELDDMNLQEYFVALGWDSDNWGSMYDAPDIYNNFWDELTDEERGNATEVCYFEHNWNGDNLKFWTTGPPTDSPTISATLAPTTSPVEQNNVSNAVEDAPSSAATCSLLILTAVTSLLSFLTSNFA